MGLVDTYYKVYRYFRWDFKYIHKDIKKGVINLIRWFPVVFKDRDWDHHFMYEIMKLKLKNMSKYLEKYGHHVGGDRDVERINTCVRLIQKIQDDFYASEYNDYHESKFHWVDVIDKPDTKRLVMDDEYDVQRLGEYFTKYPNDYRRADTMVKHMRDVPLSRAIVMGANREERARKILFTIIERNLHGWWD
jgi:hypothetical protein